MDEGNCTKSQVPNFTCNHLVPLSEYQTLIILIGVPNAIVRKVEEDLKGLEKILQESPAKQIFVLSCEITSALFLIPPPAGNEIGATKEKSNKQLQ